MQTSPWARRIHLSSHTLTAQPPGAHGELERIYRCKGNSWQSRMLVVWVKTNPLHQLSRQMISEVSAWFLLYIGVAWNFPGILPPLTSMRTVIWVFTVSSECLGSSSWILAVDQQKLLWLQLLNVACWWCIRGCRGIAGTIMGTMPVVHDLKKQQEGLGSQKTTKEGRRETKMENERLALNYRIWAIDAFCSDASKQGFSIRNIIYIVILYCFPCLYNNCIEYLNICLPTNSFHLNQMEVNWNSNQFLLKSGECTTLVKVIT